MDRFFKRQKLIKVLSGSYNKLKSCTLLKKLILCSNLLTMKTPGLNGFSGQFYYIFQEELILILNYFRKQKKKILPNPFHETNIALISKLDKYITWNLWSNALHDQRRIDFKQNFCTLNQPINKKWRYHDEMVFIPGIEDLLLFKIHLTRFSISRY